MLGDTHNKDQLSLDIRMSARGGEGGGVNIPGRGLPVTSFNVEKLVLDRRKP